ncbi:MAG: hypothetical protein IPI07_05710 [Flavobacteriales bacterium]|nr:hypothetical protein [Flavobacteriales bacterium]
MRLAIGAVLVLFVPLGLLGQPAPLFDHISTADGLPGDEVYSVFEDRLGFIWAGTGNGLARMEGTRVRLFHHDRNDSTSLAHDQVNWLTEDDQGRLWMATMAGLSRYDPVRELHLIPCRGYGERGPSGQSHAAGAVRRRHFDLGGERTWSLPLRSTVLCIP